MADYQYLTSTGTVIPDTADILTTVQTEYKDALGQDLVVTPDTPQGVLITTETAARVEVVDNNAAVANQINPNIAGGVFLDAIMALTGQQRQAQTFTVVPDVTLAGVAATSIPAGSQAKTTAGDVFASVSTVVLDGSGNATVDFQAIAAGPVQCEDNTLNTIVSNVLGWETVNNSSPGVLGSNTQSDQAARAYRNNTLAFQGVALPVAQTSAVYAVPNVQSLSFLENYTSSPMGMLVHVTNGATLSNTTWGLTTIGNITVGTTAMAFAASAQTLPTPNPWPIAKYTTTGNVTLSGLSTQGGGDWGGSMTGGDIVLTKNQTDPTQNGVWVVASGAWTRQAYNTAATVIQGAASGISLTKNSVYMCVNGGTNTNIAAAMLENKSSGAAWNGGTSVAVVEPASGQTYTVLFDRPAVISILVKVTTPNGNADAVVQSVLDYAAGNINGITGFVVGEDVSPFEISGAITAENPGIFITKVEITLSTAPTSWSTDVIVIGLNQIAYTQSSYITVVNS